MSKKILGIVLVCMVLLTGVFLPGSRPASAGDDEVLDLTLEKAIAIAMEKNADVNLAKIGIKKAEKGLDEAESAADKYEDYISSYDTAVLVRVVPRQAQMNLTLAEKGLEATKNGTKLAVENVYYDVLKARTELENAGDAVKRAEERLRLANVSLEAGTAARLDVINAEVVLAQKKVRLNAAENNYKSKVMEFNKTLGLPLNTKINLTSSFEFKPVEIDLEKVIAEAKESDVAYVGAQEALAVAEKQFEEVKKFYTPNVYTYREVQYDYEEAKLNAEKAERDLVMDIKNAYFKLQSARESYEAMQKGVEQAQEAYRLTKLRSEIGMSTQIELQEASDRLDEARAELLSALYSYNLATAQFRYGIFGFSGTSASSSGMMAGGM